MEVKVKAAVMEGPERIKIAYFPRPKVEEEASLLKVESTAICGTDLHRYWGTDRINFPVIPGHECVGILEEMGTKVNRRDHAGAPLHEGDRVAVVPCSPCGECYYCRLVPARPNLCVGHWTCYGSILCTNPPHLFGGFAEYMYLRPGSRLFKIPQGLSSDVGSLADPMSCAVSGIEKIFGIREGLSFGSMVTIQGAGPTGLMFALLARSMGAKTILIEKSPYRLQKARELGFEVLDASKTSSQERIEVVRQFGDGTGVDVAIESSGSPTVIAEGLEMLRKGGKYLIFGTAVDKGAIPINPYLICRKEIEVFGSYAYPFWKFGKALDALNKMKDACASLITHKFPIQELDYAMRMASAGESLEIVIDPLA
jgi:threonine dehydrogenase-like Zn-dependent dehydrogenase